MSKKFKIAELSNFTLLSEPRIKMLLGIPLTEKCSAITIDQVKQAYLSAEKGSEKQMAALICWKDIYEWQIKFYPSTGDELKVLYYNSPPELSALKIEALKKLAYYYGFTDTMVCEDQLNSASDLETALRRSFDFLPPSAIFVGPKGKIKLIRNSIPKGDEGVAEVAVLDNLAKDRRVLFCANWSNGEFNLQSGWFNKIRDFNNLW